MSNQGTAAARIWVPARVQMSRRKGWRMPANAKSVARGSRWGNPWAVEDLALAAARRISLATMDSLRPYAPGFGRDPGGKPWLDALKENPAVLCHARFLACVLYREAIKRWALLEPEAYQAWLAPLKGRDLACWCAPYEACHGDVLRWLLLMDQGLTSEQADKAISDGC